MLLFNNSKTWEQLENPTNIVHFLDFLEWPLMNFIGNDVL
jgi:hypothetical protein